MQSEMLTAKEAAQFARVSLSQMYSVMHGRVEGLPRLAYVGIGRRKLIRKETLDKWLHDVEAASVAETVKSHP